jgi:hypothetical protein
LLLRGMLLPIEPDLSHDAWRYMWDARVTLHGYSPYVYAPEDPQLLPLRNDSLYGLLRFLNVPTLYPPAAQAFYLLSYLLAPANLVVLKILLTICEMVSCCTLAWLLKKRGSDPALCIIYAWAPLPIIEFAIQGHIDALTIMLMLLAVLCAQSTRRGSRVLAGILLGLATLTKIYPVLLVLVVSSPNSPNSVAAQFIAPKAKVLTLFFCKLDWALLTSCIATILLAYVPYIILGHGQVFGFFSTYASEFSPNAGITTHILHWLGLTMHLDTELTLRLTYLLDLALVGSAVLIVWRKRESGRISVEAGILVLIGAIFASSSHVLTWYTTALLPWVALYMGSVRTSAAIWNPARLAVCTAWYFSSASILSYFFEGKGDWSLYYPAAYDVPLIALGLAVLCFKPKRVETRTSAPITFPEESIHTKSQRVK